MAVVGAKGKFPGPQDPGDHVPGRQKLVCDEVIGVFLIQRYVILLLTLSRITCWFSEQRLIVWGL